MYQILSYHVPLLKPNSFSQPFPSGATSVILYSILSHNPDTLTHISPYPLYLYQIPTPCTPSYLFSLTAWTISPIAALPLCLSIMCSFNISSFYNVESTPISTARTIINELLQHCLSFPHYILNSLSHHK